MSGPPYVTPATLVATFGEPEMVELTDRDTPRANVVNNAVAQLACDRAIAEVNAALAGRYTLPLATVPDLLPFLAQDLAFFYLWQVEPPTLVKTRFDAARATLSDLATGRRSLGPDVTGANVTPPIQNLPAFSPSEKAFSRGAW